MQNPEPIEAAAQEEEERKGEAQADELNDSVSDMVLSEDEDQ